MHLLRFPRGQTKPPVGALLNPDHPFMRSHLLTVPFNENLCPHGSSLPLFSPFGGSSLSLGYYASGDALDIPNPSGPPTKVSRVVGFGGNGNGSWSSNQEGLGAYTPVIGGWAANISLGSAYFVPLADVTFCIIRQLIDPRLVTGVLLDVVEWAFGPDPAAVGRIHAPSNAAGNTAFYWGGTSGANELAIGDVSYNTRVPDRMIFSAGSKGMQIWINGVKRGSSSTAVSRSQRFSQYYLMLNDQTPPSNAANQVLIMNFVHIVGEQWSDDLCRWWSAEPYAHMYSPATVRRFFMPSYPFADGFTIDGTARDILQSWSITEQLNERGTMRFGVKSMDASYRPGLREVVDFRKFDLHLFGGHIHHTDEGGLGGYGVVPIVTDCGATDFNALPDRRKVAITLPAGTLKSMLQDIKELLEVYGVTLDPAQVDGPTIADDLVFTLGPLTQVLDKFSVVTGYGWNINYDKVLSMFAPGTENAPFDIEDGDSRVKGDVRVSPTTVDYGNHITVKFTEPAVAAYVYFVIDAPPTEDEWLKVAGQTYTFKAAPSGPNEIQIEATVADQRDAIIAAIDPLDEIIATVQAGDALRVTAAEVGASGNSINVETNCVDAHWGVEGVPVASHLYNGADAALTGTAIAQDIPAQEGGANLFELVFEEPTAESLATSQALADGYLVRSLVQPREIRYRTRLHGLHPGMKQHIEVPGRNVDADCLITQVDISPEGSALLNYDVTAVEGLTIVASHQEKWRQMQSRVA